MKAHKLDESNKEIINFLKKVLKEINYIETNDEDKVKKMFYM